MVLSCDGGGSELHERPQKYDLVESGICDLAADVQTGSNPKSSSSVVLEKFNENFGVEVVAPTSVHHGTWSTYVMMNFFPPDYYQNG